MIVPTEQMSLAIGKEGQNARLAFKLTGWRIDIKDPESLREQDGELLRQARAALAEVRRPTTSPGRVASRGWSAPDGMIAVRDASSDRCDADLVGMSVDVEVEGDALEVYYNRDLRARYDYADGDAAAARRRSAGRERGRRAACDDDRRDATAAPSSAAVPRRRKGPRPKHVPQRMCVACREQRRQARR